MGEHRPTVTLQIDVFPEDSFLLNRVDENWEYEPGAEKYTPEEVATEAWSNISDWVREGYLPVLSVTMPDGTVRGVDLEKVEHDAAEAAASQEVSERVGKIKAPQHDDDGWD